MNSATDVVNHQRSGLYEVKIWPRRLGGRLAWSAYGFLLQSTLRSKSGLLTFGLVFLMHAVLYLYLSGMLRYYPNATFSVPISFPFVHIDLNPPGNYQPYILFLLTEDFHLLVNLTGVLITVALSILIGLNASLLARNWQCLSGRRSKGGGVTTAFLPSLIPNIGCCTGVPVLLGLLPGGISSIGIALGRQYGLVMAGVVFLMLWATWYTIHNIHKAQANTCYCALSDSPEANFQQGGKYE